MQIDTSQRLLPPDMLSNTSATALSEPLHTDTQQRASSKHEGYGFCWVEQTNA
jgi:hypothetical protein